MSLLCSWKLENIFCLVLGKLSHWQLPRGLSAGRHPVVHPNSFCIITTWIKFPLPSPWLWHYLECLPFTILLSVCFANTFCLISSYSICAFIISTTTHCCDDTDLDVFSHLLCCSLIRLPTVLDLICWLAAARHVVVQSFLSLLVDIFVNEKLSTNSAEQAAQRRRHGESSMFAEQQLLCCVCVCVYTGCIKAQYQVAGHPCFGSTQGHILKCNNTLWGWSSCAACEDNFYD